MFKLTLLIALLIPTMVRAECHTEQRCPVFDLTGCVWVQVCTPDRPVPRPPLLLLRPFDPTPAGYVCRQGGAEVNFMKVCQ